MEKILTNAELQKEMSDQLRALKSGNADHGHIKLYFIGVGRLVKSVQLDMDAAKQLGEPMFQRTKDFFAED